MAKSERDKRDVAPKLPTGKRKASLKPLKKDKYKGQWTDSDD